MKTLSMRSTISGDCSQREGMKSFGEEKNFVSKELRLKVIDTGVCMDRYVRPDIVDTQVVHSQSPRRRPRGNGEEGMNDIP